MAVHNVLLVEGKDDFHVFCALLEYHKVPECFTIKEKDGIENLLATLDVELLASDLHNLGIVVDADTDIGARWQALRDILTRAGYEVPAMPDADGVVLRSPDKPAVGVWLMPNNQLPGMLEDFVAFLVPPGNTLWQHAETCITQLPVTEDRFTEAHRSKAHVHTWLAWQKEPGTPLGLAVTKRYLNAEAVDVFPLLDWLRRLFDIV
jgi:hypothetical protein